MKSKGLVNAKVHAVYASRMADRDWEFVVRNVLAPMAEKGFPRPPVILVLLSQN